MSVDCYHPFAASDHLALRQDQQFSASKRNMSGKVATFGLYQWCGYE
jgi:hypothetical protein